MRIVFFGSPAPALPSLERLLGAGHVITLAVTQPPKPAGRGRRLTPSAVEAFARERGIPVIAPVRIRGEESALARIRSTEPDAIVVVAYGQIIPGPIIYLPRFRSLNVHFSLLPKFRGAAPVQWTILRGETETGITIIELNERMDEGDILARVETAVGPRETASELESRLAVMGADLLIRTLDGIDGVTRMPQEGALATLAPKIRKEDGLIDWSESADRTDRLVRALSDRPGAFTFFRGKRLLVHRGQPHGARPEVRRPGEIVAWDNDGLTVVCGGGGAYLIEELQPEGRMRMAASTFSRGARILPGEKLGES
jgi:methionyl-tRNA formyltransferase